MRKSTADEILGLTITAIFSVFIWAIAYKLLSVSFLHTFAIAVLVLASIAPLFFIGFVITLLAARIQQPSLALNNQLSAQNKQAIRNQAIFKIKNIIDKHLETLARRRLMLITVDHYGIADGSAWNKEVQRFVDKVVRPELSGPEAAAVAPQMNALFQEMIEDRVRLRSDEIEVSLDFSEQFTPTQFEQWCAKILTSMTWNATTTKASGDQGADVIADKDGTRIVLQCKLYNGTVGNKAVQEAYSAQRHYATNVSAVVTNAVFSTSARELAKTTGVLLLHYTDLTRLDSLLVTHRSSPLPRP
jgi:restriction system protein